MEPPTGDSLDQQDMIQLAAGQPEALDRIIQRHGQRLFRYLIRSLQNEADAADVAQDTFVRIYLHRYKFDSSSRFITWLYAIAANLVRDRYRWRSRRAHVSPETELDDHHENIRAALVDPDLSPEQVLIHQEQSQAVQEAIHALPADLQEPLILSVYENLSHAEIALILNCSVKAVEMKIYRARKALADRLQRWLDAP